MYVVIRDPAIERLLDSMEPAIRHGALTQLLGRPADDPEVVAARAKIRRGPLVSGLLAGQEADGGFGIHPYGKWAGAHWRLVSLADLGVPPETRGLRKAFSTVLDWLTGEGHIRGVKVIDGRAAAAAARRATRCSSPLISAPSTSHAFTSWPPISSAGSGRTVGGIATCGPV